jgi:hypothetical protein
VATQVHHLAQVLRAQSWKKRPWWIQIRSCALCCSASIMWKEGQISWTYSCWMDVGRRSSRISGVRCAWFSSSSFFMSFDSLCQKAKINPHAPRHPPTAQPPATVHPARPPGAPAAPIALHPASLLPLLPPPQAKSNLAREVQSPTINKTDQFTYGSDILQLAATTVRCATPTRKGIIVRS